MKKNICSLLFVASLIISYESYASYATHVPIQQMQEIKKAIKQEDIKKVIALLNNFDVSQTDADGNTLLHWVLMEENIDKTNRKKIIQAILDTGADINARTPERWTPLMIATDNAHTDIIKLLLAEGADCTVRNSFGMTANDIAKAIGEKELINLFKKDTAVSRACIVS